MTRAAIYNRVSTDEQAETGYSLQAQERANRLYCGMQGYEVVRVYTDDGYSGKTDKRPQFQKLLADMKARVFSYIVVHKFDRFARNTAMMMNMLEQFNEMGIGLVSVTEQIDFGTPMGKVIFALFASFGQYYVDNLSTETAKGLHEKAKRGLWVGPVPFGYKRQDRGVIIPSEDAETVREIYRLYATGEYSYWDVADALNHAGKRMYRWQKRDRVEFSREAIRVILHNRAYLGYVSAGKVEHQGNHQPLIDSATWAEVRRMTGQRTRRAGPVQASPDRLLRGLVYCAECGSKMWFRQSGRGGNSPAYGCPNRRCLNEQAHAELVEYQVIELLRLMGQLVDDASQEEQREMLLSVAEKIWLRGSEAAAVTPVERYKFMISLMGWEVRNP